MIGMNTVNESMLMALFTTSFSYTNSALYKDLTSLHTALSSSPPLLSSVYTALTAAQNDLTAMGMTSALGTNIGASGINGLYALINASGTETIPSDLSLATLTGGSGPISKIQAALNDLGTADMNSGVGTLEPMIFNTSYASQSSLFTLIFNAIAGIGSNSASSGTELGTLPSYITNIQAVINDSTFQLTALYTALTSDGVNLNMIHNMDATYTYPEVYSAMTNLLSDVQAILLRTNNNPVSGYTPTAFTTAAFSGSNSLYQTLFQTFTDMNVSSPLLATIAADLEAAQTAYTALNVSPYTSGTLGTNLNTLGTDLTAADSGALNDANSADNITHVSSSISALPTYSSTFYNLLTTAHTAIDAVVDTATTLPAAQNAVLAALLAMSDITNFSSQVASSFIGSPSTNNTLYKYLSYTLLTDLQDTTGSGGIPGSSFLADASTQLQNAIQVIANMPSISGQLGDSGSSTWSFPNLASLIGVTNQTGGLAAQIGSANSAGTNLSGTSLALKIGGTNGPLANMLDTVSGLLGVTGKVSLKDQIGGPQVNNLPSNLAAAIGGTNTDIGSMIGDPIGCHGGLALLINAPTANDNQTLFKTNQTGSQTIVYVFKNDVSLSNQITDFLNIFNPNNWATNSSHTITITNTTGEAPTSLGALTNMITSTS